MEAVAYPFQAPVKNGAGWAFFPFREYVEQVAAPEAEALVEGVVVPVFGM
ncbi:hypothetical protein AGMMS50267_10200 [Spirochaetia bacterium]|nr:hypothetical protein AGMMS50267_10200 [Spirochaetia bacterium]